MLVLCHTPKTFLNIQVTEYKYCDPHHFTSQIPSLRIHVILWLDYNHSKESYHVLRYGEMRSSPLWGKVIVNLNHLLLALSSAVNILIYSYKVSIQTLTIQDHSVQVTNNSGLIFLQVSSPYR